MNPALILGAFVCAGLIHVSAFVGTSLSPLRKVDSKYLNQYVSNLYRVNGILQSGSNTCEFEQITVGVRQQLNAAVDAGKAPKEITEIVLGFIEEYSSSFQEAGETPENFGYQVSNMLKYTMEALSDPYQFSANHQAIREPFDFYKWGNDFLRPLIIRERSKLFGKENALQLMETIRNGGNAVILSNHQTEADPQVISVLLEEEGLSELAERIIFIAGHKVTTDPVAIPFSKGRNLICIHSKKHIRNPIEDMPRKQGQNLDSVQAMTSLVRNGGNVFWVAPSGGRDRPVPADEESPFAGQYRPSKFDVKALDMFKLVAMQAGNDLRFYPMAMYSHQLVPPPETFTTSLGEKRSAKRGEVSIAFLPPTPDLGGLKDKAFTADMQKNVEDAYDQLVAFHQSPKQ